MNGYAKGSSRNDINTEISDFIFHHTTWLRSPFWYVNTTSSDIGYSSQLEFFYFCPSFFGDNNCILASFLRTLAKTVFLQSYSATAVPLPSYSRNGIYKCECGQPRHMENSFLRCNRSEHVLRLSRQIEFERRRIDYTDKNVCSHVGA